MQYHVDTVKEYLEALPENRRPAMEKIRGILLSNLSAEVAEEISSGMINYVIPLSKYPRGYHVKKNEALPFVALASQKNYIALYHMGLAALEEWFAEEYARRVATKLDIGKVCIRFRNPETIPYDLIAELCRKMTVDDYIRYYEQAIKRGG